VVTTRTHVVRQNNIDPAFESAKAENCALSILRQQDGLSFLVKNTNSKQLYMIGFIPATELGEKPFEELKASFSELPGKVIMAQDFPNATLIPNALASKDVSWTKDLLGAEANRVDSSDKLGVQVYSVAPEVAKGIQHNWLVQLERLPKVTKPKLWVNKESKVATYIACDASGAQLINSLPTTSSEELLYHLGNITEQLGWDRAAIEIEISGIGHQKAREFVKPYFKLVSSIKTEKYVKVSTALSKVDIHSYGPLLRL